MHSIGEHLLVLVAVGVLARPDDANPVPDNSVGHLMTSTPSFAKFGLIEYFVDLKLVDQCTTPVMNESRLKAVELINYPAAVCSVIYNVTAELTSADYWPVNASDVEDAKANTENYKITNVTIYETWKNVSEISPTLKLLMSPLNNIAKWKVFCLNLNHVMFPYCKFLNVEILLLYKYVLKHKQTEKEPIPSVKAKDLVDSVTELLEQKKLEFIEAREPSNIDNDPIADTDDAQKTKDDEVVVNEEQFENKDEENITEENIVPVKSIDLKDVQTESKINSKTSDDYPKEDDDTITDTKTKAQLILPKKTFTNHEFGDSEDSHFLFYFAIMTVLSMVFYLALYNKKKIIALLIEGRRSNNHRRRPNTASYSKVETDDGSTVF